MSGFNIDESILSMLDAADVAIENSRPRFTWARAEDGKGFAQVSSGTYIVLKADLLIGKNNAPYIKLVLAKKVGEDGAEIYSTNVFIPVASGDANKDKMLGIKKKQLTTLAMAADNAPLQAVVKDILTYFNRESFSVTIDAKDSSGKDGRTYVNCYYSNVTLDDASAPLRNDILKHMEDSAKRRQERNEGLQTESAKEVADETAPPF
jgi:hypothetical protein